MSSFGQAEEQVLVTILELTDREQTADDASMAAFAPGFFRRSLVDWGQAAARLSAQGLIVQTDGVYTLTASGRAQAEQLRKLRPSIWYFYVDFYAAASTSQASAAFCERVYGRNMSQHGYMTMTQLDRLIAVANLGPENRVLDLGCGNGMIAEYISDQTGAHVHGLDRELLHANIVGGVRRQTASGTRRNRPGAGTDAAWAGVRDLGHHRRRTDPRPSRQAGSRRSACGL
jgi:hypothetical protein